MDNKKRLVNTLHEYYRLYEKADLRDNDYRFHMEQSISELIGVLDYFGDRKFENFIELGGSYGGSFWVYSTLLCKPGSKLIVTDRNSRVKGLQLVVNALNEKGFKAKWYCQPNLEIKKVMNFQVELLHIDAFHTYEAVKEDFKTFAPLVNKGGFILFHDAATQPGVTQLMREIPVTNIIEAKVGFHCGIGILKR